MRMTAIIRNYIMAISAMHVRRLLHAAAEADPTDR